MARAGAARRVAGQADGEHTAGAAQVSGPLGAVLGGGAEPGSSAQLVVRRTVPLQTLRKRVLLILGSSVVQQHAVPACRKGWGYGCRRMGC
jgi:hypothetical protein